MRFLYIFLRYFLLVVFCLWLVAPLSNSSSDVLCLSGEHHPRLRRRYENFSMRAMAETAQARAYLSPAVFLGTLRSVIVQRDGTVRAWFSVATVLKMSNRNVTNNRKRSTRASSRTKNYTNYTRVAYSKNSYIGDFGQFVSLPAVRPKNPRDLYQSTYTRAMFQTVNRTLPYNIPNWTVTRQPFLSTFRRNTRTTSNKRTEDTEVVYYKSGKCVLEVNQDNLKLGSDYLVFGVPTKRHSWPSLTASALPIPNAKRTLRAVRKVLCKGCAKPPSLEGLENVKVEEGRRARFHCHLAGNPIPWVEWFKDGMKIATRSRIRVKTKRRTSRLVVRHAQRVDRGVYECRAGNVVRKEPVSLTATLTVKRKKRKTTTPVPTTTIVSSTTTSTQSSPWTTEPCQNPEFCNNGGTCLFLKDMREYVCHCAEGYYGLRCNYKDVRISLRGSVKNYSSRGAIP